jgi:ADP-ribose pyrophosphatase YjhB (NUDIX family)
LRDGRQASSDHSRSFPSRPVVGVGGVVVDQGRVLIVRRTNPPLRGEWSLPGGAVETGETLTAALQREMLEETGLVVDVGPVVDVLDRIHTDADGRVEYHYVLVDYLCSVIGGQLRPQSDAADVRWALPSEFPAYALSEPALSVIAKALRLASH